jgi:peroxiredoxin
VEGELARLGFRVVALSPDQPSRLLESLQVKDLGYALYSDARMEAARAMGIAYRLDDAGVARYRGFGIDLEEASGEQHHELPVPSVFLVEKGGRILWVYSNPDYKIRPENDRLLDAARAADASAP